jgi:hypothetical protein
LLDFRHDRIEDVGLLLVDRLRIVSLDEVGRLAHALEELLQLILGDAGEDARIGDLVTVQMEDRHLGNDNRVFFLLRSWGGANGDLHLLSESVQEAEEPVEAVSPQCLSGHPYGQGTLESSRNRLRS